MSISIQSIKKRALKEPAFFMQKQKNYLAFGSATFLYLQVPALDSSKFLASLHIVSSVTSAQVSCSLQPDINAKANIADTINEIMFFIVITPSFDQNFKQSF